MGRTEGRGKGVAVLGWGCLAGVIAVALGVAGATAEPVVRADPPPAVAPASVPVPDASGRDPNQPSSPPTAVPSSSPTATTPTAGRTPARGAALAALAGLPVKGRAPRTGYAREQFGQAWADVDRNGCDTRNDVLRRDLTRFTLKAGTNGCLVLRGTLVDPYTGRTKAFVRGPGTSSAVQVDHVVALSDAWQKGAQRLDAGRRTALANDPLNLLAVDGPTNQSKGDGDAATWLPPRKAYRCAYVARQVAVKARYGLWVTAAEHDAIERILGTCPSQGLPTTSVIPLGGGREVAASAPAPPTPKPRKTTAPSSRTDPRFGTCGEAIAAGYGPYRAGADPEYAWYRDRDGDGVVCE